MDPDMYPAIVFDHGSATCRFGFAGDDAPLGFFSSVIGRKKHSLAGTDSFVGDAAQHMRDTLTLTYPMERGIIVNWDDAQQIWDFVFQTELKVSPEQHPLFFSEPPFNPKGNREKMAEIMFENYKTPGFFLGFEPMLILFSAGRNCGTVVNIGDGCTTLASYSESRGPHHAVIRHDFGGKDLTLYLQELLYKKGYCFTSSSELERLREIKEECCSVGPNPNDPDYHKLLTHGSRKGKFQLPDGTNVDIGQDKFKVPEALFVPDGKFNKTGKGIATMVRNSVMACDISYRRDLYTNILLSGGCTFFDGFAERLKYELQQGVAPSMRVRVIAPPERKYHIWIGGSILTSLSSFTRAWITKAEYEEVGPSIVYRRCV